MTAATALPIIDTHQHFWDLERHYYPWLCDSPPRAHRYGDYGAIRRTYLPADYARDTQGYAIVATVHVEANIAAHLIVAETEWLAGLIAAHGLKTVIVAQARLDRSDVEEVLAQHVRSGPVRGIRHIPRTAPTPDQIERGGPGTLGDPRWRQGYAQLARFGFSFDLQVPFWHLEDGAALARAFPMTPLIVNSAGFPIDRGTEGLALWRRGLRALGKESNVSIKIAGLGTGAGIWPTAANVELIRFVFDTFGPDRCMIGSNFPPDRLAASFGTIMTGIMTALAVYAPADQAKILSGNAMRIYRL